MSSVNKSISQWKDIETEVVFPKKVSSARPWCVSLTLTSRLWYWNIVDDGDDDKNIAVMFYICTCLKNAAFSLKEHRIVFVLI